MVCGVLHVGVGLDVTAEPPGLFHGGAGTDNLATQAGRRKIEVLSGLTRFCAGMENVHDREYEQELGLGDTLFVYTDGVTEAVDGTNIQLEEERMLQSLHRVSECCLEEFLRCSSVFAAG